MAVRFQKIAPTDIEQESFRIIAEEYGPIDFDETTFRIVQRVIHATGDFSFKDNLRFSSEAIKRGVENIISGKDILTDVSMVASGISKPLLQKWGGTVICRIADPDIAAIAQERCQTRSEAAIEASLGENTGIIAIGNAPTALIKAVNVVSSMPADKRPLVIGVPVGFVNAAESKQYLFEENDCYITSLGRKGGSPVAAAIVNALLRIAEQSS